VATGYDQIVYAEAGRVLSLIISYVYHNRDWENRERRAWSRIFD
jgi:deoxyhypusine synthase